MNPTFWLSRTAVAFGLHLAYVALILLTDSLAGSLWGFLPLVLMPLYECVVGFVFCFFTYRRCRRISHCFYSVGGALLAVGGLYELALMIQKGFSLDGLALLFDLLIVGSLLLGGGFGIRTEKLREKIAKRRTRFDD